MNDNCEAKGEKALVSLHTQMNQLYNSFSNWNSEAIYRGIV